MSRFQLTRAVVLGITIGVLAQASLAGEAAGDSKPASVKSWATPADPVSPAATASRAGPRPVPVNEGSGVYYARRYGVDNLHVRSLGSGFTLEFRYRVQDVNKAKVLADKRFNPVMIDQLTGNRLAIPNMENVGNLRQAVPQEQGRDYWMVFANAGRQVKPGQRVDVVIGSFRAEGLTVE